MGTSRAGMVQFESISDNFSDDEKRSTAVIVRIDTYSILGSHARSSLDTGIFSITAGAISQPNATLLESYTTADDPHFFAFSLVALITDMKGVGDLFLFDLIGQNSGFRQTGNISVTFVGDYGPAPQESAVEASYILDSQVSEVSVVPIPAAFWLFGATLLGLGVIARRRA